MRIGGNVIEYDLIVDSTAGGEVTDPGEGTFTKTEGTEVTLVAVAEAGYEFVEWTGDTGDIADTSSATTTITMNDDATIKANFEEIVCFTPDVVAEVDGNAITEIDLTADPMEGFDVVFTITNNRTVTDTQNWRWRYELFTDNDESLGYGTSGERSVELGPGDSDTETYDLNQDVTDTWGVGYYFILTATSLCDNEVAEWRVDILGVNINTADFDTLQLIIHIGPFRAQQIIDLRVDEPFSSLDDLTRVDGINGAGTRLQQIKDEGIAYVE